MAHVTCVASSDAVHRTMADRVNEILENMVPQLEDLRKRGLCSASEVKSLVRRREAHEYRLNRPASTKHDFLTALQLEMNLEQLVKVRRKKMGLPRRGAADDAVRKRVHFIFDRALRRFRGDEEMWLQWIGYAERTGAQSRLSRVFARALALLPRSTALWIRAAWWEVTGRQNVAGARSLLQRAIRINGAEPELWHAYFRLELVGLHKLKIRRQQLGLEDEEEDEGEDEEGDGEEEEEADDEEEEDGDEMGLDELVAAEAAAMEVDGGSSSVLSSGLAAASSSSSGNDGAAAAGEESSSLGPLEIPWLVFSHLLTSGLPIATQLNCLRTCYEFPSTVALREKMSRAILEGSPNDAEAATGVATIVYSKLPTEGWSKAHTAGVKAGLAKFEEMLKRKPGWW